MDLIDRSKLEAFCTICKSQDYIDGIKDTLEYIDNLPKVDAIPIEWIEQYVKSKTALLGDSELWMKWMIDDWEKEQEKQNDF